MWPSEAWWGTGFKKKKNKNNISTEKEIVNSMEMVLDPWILPWDLANDPREAPPMVLDGKGSLGCT